MLYVQKVKKSFDHFMAVREADLEVKKGEIVAVIGPNGAGKSTLFKIIAGLLKPDGGRILFKDQDIAGLPAYITCQRGIGLSFQIVNLFNRLTVFENVQAAVLSKRKKIYNMFYPASKMVVAETNAVLDKVGLSSAHNRVSGSLSHGEQKVLEIAIALGSDPELLILDEPTAGMSPEETFATIDLIRKLTSEFGLTVLFCEHDIELVFSIADRIMVMNQGVSIIQAEPDVVKNDKLVQEAYLGSSH